LFQAFVDEDFPEEPEHERGVVRFIAATGWLDCRAIERDGSPGVNFTWEGIDEGDQVSGRGWAVLVDDDMIEGHLLFHLGDDSSFRRSRSPALTKWMSRERISVLRVPGDRSASR
jgi:hypothetical protein